MLASDKKACYSSAPVEKRGNKEAVRRQTRLLEKALFCSVRKCSKSSKKSGKEVQDKKSVD
jgi:hypothetical protein